MVELNFALSLDIGSILLTFPQENLEAPCILMFTTSKDKKGEEAETLLKIKLSVKIKGTVVKYENSCVMETSDDSFGTNEVNSSGLEISTVESGNEVLLSFNKQPLKKRKLGVSAVEDMIIGKELSDIYINIAQNLLKRQFLKLWDLATTNCVARDNKNQQNRKLAATNCAVCQLVPLNCHHH